MKSKALLTGADVGDEVGVLVGANVFIRKEIDKGKRYESVTSSDTTKCMYM